MLFSGYQLGAHLLNSTSESVLLDRAAVVKGEERVYVYEDRLNSVKPTRNSSFTVGGPFGTGSTTFLIKQPQFNEAGMLSSLRNEVYILQLLRAAKIRQADTFVGFDQFQYLLFQRHIAGRPLNANGLPPTAVLVKLCRQLGPLLSQVHAINLEALETPNQTSQDTDEPVQWPNQFGYRKPLLFVLAIRDLNDLLANNPTLNQQEVIHRLTRQKDGAPYTLLKTIQACTWEQHALIHYDFKFDHLLLSDQNDINALIDWEMADLGDIHWDLATVWYELLRPFMITNRPVDTVFQASLEPLNQLLATYQFAAPVSVVKLKQFLGIVLLQKCFYSALGDNLELERGRQWLDLAERLLTTALLPDPLPSQPTAFAIQLDGPPESPPLRHVHLNSTLGSLGEIDELVRTLIERHDDILLKGLSLHEFIYQWYNGNLDRPLETSAKAEIAKPPRVGNEILLEDYWWRVEGVSKSNNQVIRKSSCRRMATPGTFVYLSHDARNLQTGVSSYVKHIFPNFVVRPNDARRDRNDLWVNGQLQLAQDFANWVRFYFNLKGNFDGINLFIDTLSAKLNERQIPFQLKLRNSLASYTRSDSAILFIHRQHTSAALDSITYTYHVLSKAGFIDDSASPRFTKKIGEFGGLSYAENPPHATLSFGTWRAQLIAEAIGDDFLTTTIPPDSIPAVRRQLKEKIINTLQQEGFNVFELYRNPFPRAGEFKFRLDKFADKLKTPALLDVGLGTSITFLPQQRFLKAARDVGFTLCREAVWYGDACTWFCFQKDEAGASLFATATQAEQLGIALLLAQLALLCPQERIFVECLRGCVPDLPEQLGACTEKIIATIRSLPDQVPVPITNQTVDYTVLRSVLYGSLTVTELQKSIPLAEALLTKYITRRMPFPNGYVVDANKLVSSEFNPTLTHGLAALGYFFLLFVENPDYKVVDLSELYDTSSLHGLINWRDAWQWGPYEYLL